MESMVRTVRAVGSEFAVRKVRGILVPFAVGAVLVMAVSGWLIHFTLWWLVVALPLFVAILFGVALLLAALFVARRLSPAMSGEQRAAVGSFADKLERVAGNVQVPVFWMIVRVVRDILRPRSNGFISTLTKDGTTLHTDFLQLQKLF